MSMILAFNLSNLITKPFGWLLAQLYQFTANYGLAVIIFAVIVRLVLLPITAKSKKSMMKMSRIQPRIQEIQRKYANDQKKQQEAIQKLQAEEGVSMGCGGCIWSLIPLLILIPLYSVIRYPIQYLLGETAEIAKQIATAVGINVQKDFYYEINAITSGNLKEAIQSNGIAIANQATLNGLNFNFLGIDLGQDPTVFGLFGGDWKWDWNHLGGVLIPMLSAGSQVVSMLLSQRSNNSVITDEKGLVDKETAKNSQANQTSKTMMWIMPAMSLYIGFTVPAALSLYWLIGGVVAMVENELLTNHYRKIYDAEDAVRLQKAMELEAIEEEKERLRAERRAANPEGITSNTSKKKLQQNKQREQEAAKVASAKEYAEKKGIVTEEEPKNTTMSGIPSRPYCKGRNYDPNRYSNTTEE
jgi:YidC/Oxa1 family membrane protein insertase